MRLLFSDRFQRFVARCSFQERCEVAEAGFKWDDAFRQWWATDLAIADKLFKYAEGQALEKLEDRRSAFLDSIAHDAELDTADIVPDGLELLPYQKAGVAFITKRVNSLVGDDMGLGKTVEAIVACNVWRPASVLVLCPASVVINWQSEFDKWGLVDGLELCVLSYTKAARAEYLRSLLRPWGVLILDEAHYLKNYKAKRTKAVLKHLVGRAARVVALTGTPIPNKPREIFPIVSSLAPDLFGRSFDGFAKRYCDAHFDDFGYWNTDGSSNLTELQDKLRSTIMIRRQKEDVLRELPAKRYQTIVFDSDADKTARAAKLSDKPELNDLGGYDIEGSELGDMATQRRELGVAKVPKVLAHVRDVLQSEDKALVFAHHKDVVRLLAEGLAEFGVVTLTGETASEKRGEVVRDFQEGKARVFIGNIQAAGVGITLTAASVVIMAELDWTPASMDQAIDRAHRIGQRRSVLVQLLVLDGTLEAYIADVYKAKREVVKSALDIF